MQLPSTFTSCTLLQVQCTYRATPLSGVPDAYVACTFFQGANAVLVHVQGASRARTVITGLQRGHREFLVAVRREGQFVGEMAAFASAALRCASVRARGPVRAKIVPGELLRACVERVPEVGPLCQPAPASLAELLASRLLLHMVHVM